MKVEIHALSSSRTYLILAEGATPPTHLDLTGAKLFKRMDLQPGDNRVAMDTEQVLEDLGAQGWAVVGVEVLVG